MAIIVKCGVNCQMRLWRLNGISSLVLRTRRRQSDLIERTECGMETELEMIIFSLLTVTQLSNTISSVRVNVLHL